MRIRICTLAIVGVGVERRGEIRWMIRQIEVEVTVFLWCEFYLEFKRWSEANRAKTCYGGLEIIYVQIASYLSLFLFCFCGSMKIIQRRIKWPEILKPTKWLNLNWITHTHTHTHTHTLRHTLTASLWTNQCWNFYEIFELILSSKEQVSLPAWRENVEVYLLRK